MPSQPKLRKKKVGKSLYWCNFSITLGRQAARGYYSFSISLGEHLLFQRKSLFFSNQLPG